MGRRPTKPGSIPRLRERRRGDKIYYYYDLGGKPRKELSLGTDYGLAITEYARLERARTADAKLAETLTFRYVAQRYFIDVVPTKALQRRRTTPASSSNCWRSSMIHLQPSGISNRSTSSST